MTGPGIDVRLLTADDDLEPEVDLAERAFGGTRRDRHLRRARGLIADGRLIGVFDGPALVASAWYFDMRQWWHGRSLPMAGVAAVKVAPEERGRGVGRAMMTALLQQVAGRGYPLSVLYPAANGVYRATGWEFGGGQYEVTVPSRALRSLVAPDPAAGLADPGTTPVRRAGPADAAEMIAVDGALAAAARACGPITYSAADLAPLLSDDVFCYLAPDGSLAYGWNRSQDEVLAYSVAAGSAATFRSLWSVLASHATMVGNVRAFVAPDSPLTWLTSQPDVRLRRKDAWMLRLVDAPAAIAGRGFPAGAVVTAALTLADDQLPANAGRWLLEISGGKGLLSRADGGSAALPAGGGEPLRLGPRGLAALYSGTPLATLRIAGLVGGGEPAADAALDEAFGCTAYMYDYF
ncbi:MAG TPA: GNAT family N-acetyltransferase [Streptosporangiaceae bacterium]|nr:GNAT family N-acetyltransferase [Streptosporangiaceae bacterium]